MINRADLLKSLQALLPHIEKDILSYSEANAELSEHLQSEYRAAVEAERTAEHFVSWREAQITQAAVAWVLTCVFVRFLEDNGLLTEPVLAGPVRDVQGRNALQQAKERIVAYFNENPTFEERHYLLDLFAELEKYPVIAELLDHRHNPLWQIPVSADGAKRLIDFFQKIDADSGEILHDFTDQEWDTRFLGDLYQDLSESVRKRYALLQTPEFVESFILDYTLEPAIQTFGLPGLRLIDPTCGSGHFLLTTFERVFNQWLKREPGTNTRELAQRALDVVHGTDINPYAIAICRFRLLIAAMKAAGSSRIKDAPSFQFNLACADSLLHGRRFEWQGQGIQGGLLDEVKRHVYEVEDSQKLNKILGQRYHVVVGNPPYITVKDKALNQAYRDKYPTCHRKYSLGAPFTERFFDLTLSPEGNQPAGFMGMITANSFMKREFGKKLIEEYLPRKDLTHVVDTSGAYIPGHGTPTVILFARNQAPKSDFLRAVLGVRGEPGTPQNAELGKVWTSIVELLPEAGSGNEFISVLDQSRGLFCVHPWSVGGGGISELKELVEATDERLEDVCESIGFLTITGEDNVFVLPKKAADRLGLKSAHFCEGENLRDWTIEFADAVVFPYKEEHGQLLVDDTSELKYFWSYRSLLSARKMFGKSPIEHGLKWNELIYLARKRYFSECLIAFAFVSTHNNFVFAPRGRLFKQSAPVVKLRADAVENDYLAILGLLNSSIACFWMKQVFHNKGASSDKGVLQDDPERFRFEFDGTKLKKFPLPVFGGDNRDKLIELVREIIAATNALGEFSIESLLELSRREGLELSDVVKNLIKDRDAIRGRMVRLQEEMDWLCYEIYGLIKPGEKVCSLVHELVPSSMPEMIPDNRPYRKPDAFDLDVDRERFNYLNFNENVALVERPEYKRRWFRSAGAYDAQNLSDELIFTRQIKDWLLDRCEKACQLSGLQSCAQLADLLRRDKELLKVAEIYCGSDVIDLQALVVDLVEIDNVPQMAAARLKPDSLPKFYAWQETWEKQRLEDAIDVKYGVDQPLAEKDAGDPEKRAKYDLALARAKLEKAENVGDIPLPPQYKPTDFRKSSYWSLRGKLDVPKERFFSLPGCEKGGDSTLVIGWAGLNHLQRAQAIAAWYLDRKEGEGWETERLIPMLVALDELIPWLKQWHNEVDPEFGERMGDYYEGFLLEELRNLEITRADLLSWQPAAVAGKRGGRKKKVAEQN
ncbi:TPA: BREX-2 system adenine-specific DNA-methyltransferase PglX [Pseudomonas aeruginosa]|uniref:BREX-2 system adenine-specific DNA-methyltransferase PglX n=1 Tax=Pseudomonas aeruginosa TaxID=287 RepID=UPI00113FCCF7|nr:BREX-2 system adenine-specific DNA-methyltransferase PglX [Pseudomonas aeruginosa]HBO3456332.1 BREX-2 system adenine-specific DNA-methyltransferase PglX [Pseudomonas aeruginosa]HEJ5961048.1 BREX-2 system adenine-specific DNA-methyltransferase PglX [Pseudomonas aeruginosa]